MKLLLISYLWILLQLSEPLPSSVIKALEYPQAFIGQSKPTHLIATNSGFIAALDSSLLIIKEDSDILNYSEVVRPLCMQSGVAARDILYCFEDGLCCLVAWPSYPACCTDVAPNAMSTFENRFYVSSYLFADDRKIIKIAKYNMAIKSFIQEPIIWEGIVKNKNFVSREFFFNFRTNLYVYFIAIDTLNISAAHPEVLERKIRLIRACHDDNDTEPSMFEIELDCGPLDNNTKIISVSQLNRTVLFGLSNAGGTGKFCMFTTTSIDLAIARIYDMCYGGNYLSELSWGEGYPCKGFDEVSNSECDFGKGNSLHAIPEHTLAGSTPVNCTMLQGYDGQTVLDATVFDMEEGIQYLYVAQDHGVIVKYLLSPSFQSMKRICVYEVLSPILQISSGSEVVCATTENEVLLINSDSCGSYGNCSACIGSSDPLCGWCVLEGVCSRSLVCAHHILPGRWAVESCPSGTIDLQMYDVAIVHHDYQQQLVIQILLSETTPFPGLEQKERYYCVSNDTALEVVELVQLDETMSCTFNGRQLFRKIRTTIKVTLTSYKEPLQNFTVAGVVAIHSCDLYKNCKACESTSACGWCPYRGKCTVVMDECYHRDSWINKTTMVIVTIQVSGTRCPVLLPGHYMLPVLVSKNLPLITSNIHPPIDGINYVCTFQYPDGNHIHVPALYIKGNLSCQVVDGIFMVKGTGAEQLEMSVWTNSSNGDMWQIEYYDVLPDAHYYYDSEEAPEPSDQHPRPRSATMTVFNCSAFAESCSLCTFQNQQNNFNCYWCASGSNQHTCTNLEFCSSSGNTVLINSSTQCFAPPIIGSVNPFSGPTVGGTHVTISGFDLGVSYLEIEVLLGDSHCEILPSQYIIGMNVSTTTRQVVCRTNSSASTGFVNITVMVRRDGSRSTAMFFAQYAAGTRRAFLYALPELHGVDPEFGASSGGTLVVLSGSSLNISDTSFTSVRLAGHECMLRRTTFSEIWCISSAAGSPTNGSVQVMIDGADLSGHVFHYLEDPQYHSVHPQYIIPSGGVEVLFTGKYLDIAKQPKLVVFFEGNGYYSNQCSASGDGLSLLCLSPRLPSLLGLPATRGRDDAMLLNYTVMLDGAPGPNASLTLHLRPDPVFIQLADNSQQYQVLSRESITIEGQYLDSVTQSEILVSLLGEECSIISVTAVMITCHPPDLPVSQDRDIEVKVSVANGSLEFSAGFIRYLRSETVLRSETDFSWLLVIIGCVLLLAVAMMLVCVMTMVWLTCVMRRRATSTICEETTVPALQLQKPASHEHEENVYEMIPEYVQGPGAQGSVIPANRPTSSTQVQRKTAHVISTYRSSTQSSCGSLQLYGQNSATLNANVSDEYVEMGSHCVSTNLNSPQDDATLDRKREHLCPEDGLSNAEYVDMRPEVAIDGQSHISASEC